MRKILSLFTIFFLMISGVYSQEEEIENADVFISQIDGKYDLNSVRIEYPDGSVFFGKGTEEGFPIYGTLSNYEKQEFYTGAFDENEKYTGEAVWETPDFHFEGTFKDGKKNGYGTLYDKRLNRTYEGNFLNDKKNSKGLEYDSNSSYYYEGNWENELYQGFGLLISKTGARYEGNFEKGEIKGYGTKIYPTGKVLKGNWENPDVLNGDDCTYLSNGKTKYSGSIVDGKFEGYGVFTDSNGIKYEGSFIENQRTGFGQQVYSDGSVYTGYYYGNQRNKEGIFEFSNGYTYEGGFLNGVFHGNGFLTAEENEEITVIASSEWDGLSVPENSEGSSTFGEESVVASSILPRSGKILFSNGDMWEGYMVQGNPIAGLGIWTTQEERLAKIEKGSKEIILCSYKIHDKEYDLSSVYSDCEVQDIISSETYLASFNDYYLKHKKTIDKIVGGLQLVSSVLSIVPNPIQPISIGIDIGLSALQISLKTISTSERIYDVCVAGNQSLIPSLLKDYGKDIAWDAINCLFATAGSMDALGKLGSKIGKGMGEAGQKIAQITSNVIRKNPVLSKAAKNLDNLAKIGKASMKTYVEAATNSRFFQYVAKTGGKVTHTIKTGWIKIVYPKLFAKYGDDATRLLFKYGDSIAEQLGKNGDIICKTARKNGDDFVRIFLKNGDRIAAIARSSEYPEAVVRYINNCANAEDAIRIASKYSSLGGIVNKYGDDAILIIERYGDDVVKIIEKNDELFFNGIKKIPQSEYVSYLKVLKNHPEYTSVICNNDTGKILSLIRKAGVKKETSILNAIKKGGSEAVEILNLIPKNDFIRTVDFLDVFDISTYKTIAKNGLPQKITSQVIQDSKDIAFLHDSIRGNLINPNTDDIVNYVKHEDRYISGQELKSNTVYRTGEGNYYYQTDEFGRLSRCETSNLRLQEDIRNTKKYIRDSHNSNTPNKKSTDDAGHVIASRFGGSGELDNLISQNSNLNKSSWKIMENKWVDELHKGNKVHVKIDIKYADSSKRPSEFIVTQIINGKVQIFNFLNI